jgi:G:T-mismatch repair DNA endonuclease (very short patch repair protein)
MNQSDDQSSQSLSQITFGSLQEAESSFRVLVEWVCALAQQVQAIEERLNRAKEALDGQNKV